jgi:hypothetical protein
LRIPSNESTPRSMKIVTNKPEIMLMIGRVRFLVIMRFFM